MGGRRDVDDNLSGHGSPRDNPVLPRRRFQDFLPGEGLLSARFSRPATGVSASQDAPFQTFASFKRKVSTGCLRSFPVSRPEMPCFKSGHFSVCLSLRQTDLPQSFGDAIEHRARMDKRRHDL
jgi:hypothetical protein